MPTYDQEQHDNFYNLDTPEVGAAPNQTDKVYCLTCHTHVKLYRSDAAGPDCVRLTYECGHTAYVGGGLQARAFAEIDAALVYRAALQRIPGLSTEDKRSYSALVRSHRARFRTIRAAQRVLGDRS